MDKPAYTAMCVAVLALSVLAAPHAHANMYRWIGEDGSLTYSDSPPADPSRVRELTRVINPPTLPSQPAAKAPAPAPAARQSAPANGEKLDPLFVFVPPAARQQPAPPPQVTIAPPDLPPARTDVPPMDLPRAETAPPPKTQSAPRLVYRGAPSTAAQDPCLRSSDARCYERNKDRYHPFLGYNPGGTAVGATGGSGGGAVGGSFTR